MGIITRILYGKPWDLLTNEQKDSRADKFWAGVSLEYKIFIVRHMVDMTMMRIMARFLRISRKGGD
ncbi:MAG: hypothetical protein HPY50_07165 [Firmicutes bacterium]|nr:hypothetical protein [Bacillota bacterium]